jgi:hypothetical protein
MIPNRLSPNFSFLIGEEDNNFDASFCAYHNQQVYFENAGSPNLYITEANLIAFFKTWPNLKLIDIHNCKVLSNEVIKTILDCSPRATRRVFKHCTGSFDPKYMIKWYLDDK